MPRTPPNPVDLAKSVFAVAVSERPGRVSARHRFTRAQFARFLATTPPATVVMDACGTAHYWGRQAQAHGHRVVLLASHVVRPYVARNKTDRSDTTGLLEAHRNEALHPVPVQSVAQPALTALHRRRSTWLATRTARLNTVRGLLREFGLALPVGAHQVRPAVAALLADADSALPAAVRPALQSALDELATLEQRLRTVEQQLAALAAELPAVTTLRTIPGVGLLTATALVGCVGDAHLPDDTAHDSILRGNGRNRWIQAAVPFEDAAIDPITEDAVEQWTCEADLVAGRENVRIDLLDEFDSERRSTRSVLKVERCLKKVVRLADQWPPRRKTADADVPAKVLGVWKLRSKEADCSLIHPKPNRRLH